MPLVAGKRRNVRFPLAHLKTAPLATAQQKQKQKQKHGHQKHNLNLENRLGNHSTFSTSGEMAESAAQPGIPALFTQPPSLRDPLVTETTDLQDATLSKCLPFLKGISDGQKGPFNANGVPALQRADHLEYLYDALEDYPAGFVAMDSSRPWMIYWGLAGLTLMGEDVTPIRERVIESLRPMQNPTGGFGGGHGQVSHLASSYAAILSLAMVGGSDAFALVDRKTMWQWLGNLKQSDGGFRVCEGGEEDVRGAYCASVIISLLDLPLGLPPGRRVELSGWTKLTDGLAKYLARCQTFEGGISGSPGSEAHGAYAFCALACLSILGPPRTNYRKSALDGHPQSASAPSKTIGSLFSHEGLARYILSCCQHPYGGLRDKPGKHADSYHTCYVLTGLSATQHHHYRTDSSPCTNETFSSAFSWQSRPTSREEDVFEEGDRLTSFHPIYVIPHQAAERMRLWYEAESSPVV
ncbi:hypothetical protein N7450_002921 [Penicillium hetheringtonii]|uniref:Prenyltransferase alpha-alpha toroid domain-containing protein n=1 Tax=Penicillium hetheringtonii TaxID=911720 RepID=A0AAD6DX00_9EURO|nr:hypothetical protein N7450_002921 [Penicillium hetheringtonii]